MKKVNEKMFTKEESNSAVGKKYIYLEENYEICRRKGLYRVERNQVIKQLSKKCKSSKKFINLLIKICIDFGVSDYRDIIEDFIK